MKTGWLMEGNPHQPPGRRPDRRLGGAGGHRLYLPAAGIHPVRAEPDGAPLRKRQKAGMSGERVPRNGWSISVRMHMSAGRYMCGEESGLLNALEGRRATPRNKPPFPQVSGLWAGQPL